MNGLPKPTRKPRLIRRETRQEIHEDGHSWAVSYADFLMVLLSFFILFFSVDETKRQEIIDKVASAAQSKGGANAQGKNRSIAKEDRLPAGLADITTGVDGFYTQRANNSQKLFIYFDNDIFKPGQIDLPPAQIEKLKNILGRIEPFLDKINVTFEGHTDNTQVTLVKNRYIDNNFDLASLRATKALQLAVRAGLDPTKLFAKGVAEHSRGSRTLSLVITSSEADQ